MPDGYPSGFTFPIECIPNRAAYSDRGWCHCESSVASLTKNSAFVLDLGKLPSGKLPPEPEQFGSLIRQCVSGRAAPVLPDEFAAQLENKALTSKKADLLT